MALVSLTAKEFDLAGDVLIDAPSIDLGDDRRRANRVATLDGGAVVNDFGYSHADRTVQLRWTVTEQQDETVRRLIRLHDRVRCALRGEVLECLIDGYAVRNGAASLSLMALANLTET